MRPLTIAIAALGGQGGGVLADWLISAAEHHGWRVQTTSIPGVAQRTGTTVYYLEVAAPPAAGESPPVMALMPVPGDVDLMVAAELMEAGRAMLRGLVTPERTTLIMSSHRVYGITEKSVPGDGIVDSQPVLVAAAAQAHRLFSFDMDAMAAQHGCVISAVLLGAIAGGGVLPFARGAYEQAIRESGMAVSKNLAGFAAGLVGAVKSIPATGLVASASTPTSVAGRALEQRVSANFPAHLHGVIVEGVKRMMDYQDAAYAADYLSRLDAVLVEDRAVGGQNRPGPDGVATPLTVERAAGANNFALTATVARYLALWMSYEDTIRVADLKTRSARFTRFRGEVKAAPVQIVYVSEFMHPRYQEFCETLPAGIGRRLLRSRRARKMLSPLFARGRQVQTGRVRGFALLYLLARLKRFRRRTLRFATEQAGIEAWLDLIRSTAARDYALAVEIAECQRLIKGYGDTHARGKQNYDLVVAEIGRGAAAGRVRTLRQAALADENGLIRLLDI